MEIIPVINCPDIGCVQQKIAAAKIFLPLGEFLHLDVTDGVFATHKTWADPVVWATMGVPFDLEVHLMVEHPEEYAEEWLAAGAKRLIVHVETLMDDAREDENIIKGLLQKCAEHEAELMLSSNIETPIEEFEPFLAVKKFQVLAVHPGPAAQEFLPEALEKIKALRLLVGPNAIIEVDGGMNPQTAPLVKDAGANIIVSSHFIFSNADPRRAYEELGSVA